LNVENKVAATLIGYPLSTDFRHFPNCSPYHPILMRHAEKYFRGATHPLSKLFHADASEKQGGLGRIHQERIKKMSHKSSFIFSRYKGDLYDFLLEQKRMSCESITAECEELANITVGFITTILRYGLPKDVPSESSPPEREGWTELVISFFVGLMNHTRNKMDCRLNW